MNFFVDKEILAKNVLAKVKKKGFGKLNIESKKVCGVIFFKILEIISHFRFSRYFF